MINVLMVLTSITTDGVTSYAMNYFRHLNKEKIHMDFVIFRPEFVVEELKNEIIDSGSIIYTIPVNNGIKNHISKCSEILTNKKYDIIHNNTLGISYFLMREAKKNNVKVRILHCHNSRLGETKIKELRNYLLTILLKKTVNEYAACSKTAAKSMFGTTNVSIIPNIIDGEKFAFKKEVRSKMRRKNNLANNYLILSIGRLCLQKNPFFAIDVFAEVYKLNKNARYWWVGDGPLRESIQQYINEKGLSDVITLLGNQLDTASIYMTADCFFLPSLFEGLPVTVLEAQCCGLPCVLSNRITKEVEYTNLVQYYSLDEQPVKWAIMIEKVAGQAREIYRQVQKSSQFSEINACAMLENYYRELMRNR